MLEAMKVGYKELRKILEIYIENRWPLLIVGNPGVGKTEMIAQVTRAQDKDLVITHPATHDPVFYSGIPIEVDKEAELRPVGQIKRALNAVKETVLFFDDFGQASIAVQKAIMQLFDGTASGVEGHTINPDLISLVAASNFVTDGAGVAGVITPFKNRLQGIVHLEPSSGDWIMWAARNDLEESVIAYIAAYPQNLSRPDSRIDTMYTNPSPRVWKKISDIFKSRVPDDLHVVLCTGLLGEKVATEYIAFRAFYRDLPSQQDIENHGAGFTWDDSKLKGPKFYALLGRQAKRLAATKVAKNYQAMENIIEFMQANRTSRELIRLMIQMGQQYDEKLLESPPMIKWIGKNAEMFAGLATGR